MPYATRFSLISNNPTDWIFRGLFLFTAVLLLSFSCYRIVAKASSEAWPLVYGKVVSSETVKRQGRSADWCIKLKYTYVVKGVHYSSHTLSNSRFAGVGCDFRKEIVLKRFGYPQVGDKISIQYQPEKPDTSILIQDDLRGVTIIGCIGVMLLIVGLIRTKPATSATEKGLKS